MAAVAKSVALMSGEKSEEVNVIAEPACFRQQAIEDVQYAGACRGCRQNPPQWAGFTRQPYRDIASQNRVLTSKKQEPQNAWSCGVHHLSGNSPTRGWICYNCGHLGHITKACRNSKVSGVVPVAVTDEVSGSLHKLSLLVAKDLSAPALLGSDWLPALRSGWQDHLLANSQVLSMHVVVPSGVVNRAEVLVDLKSKYTKAFSVVNNDKPISGYKVNIHLKGSTIPVFHRAYDVPYAIVQNLKEELYKLEQAGIISRLEVEEPCRGLLTINTINGLYRFNRLVSGLASALAIFKSDIESSLFEIGNVTAYLDDILIGGKDGQECAMNLNFVLGNSLEFLGLQFSGQGKSPTKSKIEKITAAPAPTDTIQYARTPPQPVMQRCPYRYHSVEIISLLNYYRQCIPMCPDMLEPLHNLLCKDVPWVWMSESSLVVFDPTKEIVLQLDSSGYGVGTVLSKIINEIECSIAFESATLTTAQRNYSPLAKEALAIISGVKKFLNYLYGHTSTIVSDHQPLMSLFSEAKKLLHMASSRILHWGVILSACNYSIVYKKGKHIPQADAMSCLPSTVPVGVKECNFLYLTTPLVSPGEVAQETKMDQVLRKIIKVYENGWPHHCSNKILEPFFTMRHWLSIRDGVLLNGNRVVIPQSLPAKDPLERIHLDLFHFNSVKYSILCDAYSKWVECFFLPIHTSFQSVLKCLLEVFARFTFPHTIVCNNGPPFCARDPAQFCRLSSIKLLFTPPYNPSSNGLAERSVQAFKKLLTRSFMPHLSNALLLSQRLNDCLLVYHSTPSSVTGFSPMASLFPYNPRIPLSMLTPKGEARRSHPTTRCLSGYKINQKIWVNLQISKTVVKWAPECIMHNIGKVHQCQLRHNACKEPDTNENCPMIRPLHQPFQTELEIADRHDGTSSEGEEEGKGFCGFPHDEDEMIHRVCKWGCRICTAARY
ncbi:hypothetical protein PR048_012607 [Dryococelus australis]|uniref:Reverse transcriptase n=1 Tax=Dryococelus australis TaxID=614101 RepID=A0ABQ9HPV8_9NEOP|nr:hypothetical protein PR048_012607 [Dryococelus australis]